MDGAATQSASEVVRTFLGHLQARDLPAAEAMLADGFVMTVAGNKKFKSLREFAAFSKTRQQGSVKTHERFDEVPDGDAVIVYCMGSMAGAWLDGSLFDNVRFIDRFVVRDGLIADMMVWSDMGEFRPKSAG